MKTRPRQCSAVKRQALIDLIESQIEAATNFVTELQLYRMWLTHGLVPPTHVAALLRAQMGGTQ